MSGWLEDFGDHMVTFAALSDAILEESLGTWGGGGEGGGRREEKEGKKEVEEKEEGFPQGEV